ncbi:LysM peptidoglycan-binding domain-containing protein [Brachyspira pilosicoli]|uniref:LysM peptidoglycan-binding domain-containing protein n=1 Tax=Brachyspira pilosicoli TaxID=52584 RepID=A0AAJ6GEH7_BRAPL|nr:LysM peptidoglycan-binding domain-containing protein [Brachyspira pilosicoli]WIH90865.1 LysM peptidoglycan-binding domain-containing protein [Brachyspira pilosicoli]WIH93156.1 LysM peptidoglycan-binding domain-containing protein [Brachyspira pilosicoli]WIH95446.1 LysM peptidoglycan-binding domain-containing protein [Brachyspira pilosicoli]
MKKILFISFFASFFYSFSFAVNYIDYKVENGDTLYGIAFAHDMTASEFLKLNKIKDPDKYNLKVGETLKVKEKGYDLVYDAKAKSYGLKPEKKKSYTDYKVKDGDTVLGIAFSHGMTASEFCAINNIEDFNKYQLKKGEILKVANVSNAEEIKKEEVNLNVENIKKEIEQNKYIDYQVKDGDTVLGIAFSHGMSASEFCSVNNIEDFNKYQLRKGQILKVANTSNISKEEVTTDNIEKIEEIKEPINNYTEYKVKNGDTLYGIAFSHGMTANEFLKLNNIDDPNKYNLKVGETLKIKNNNDSNIERVENKDVEEIKENINTEKNNNYIDYKVKNGDTLYGIAFENDMSVNEFLKINNISDPIAYKLKVGETLKIQSKIQNKVDSSRTTKIYKVKRGDTLGAIAINNSMSLDDLLKLNSLKRDYVLKIGDNIKVYDKISVKLDSNSIEKSDYIKIESYKVKSGDTLSEIAVAKKMDLVELYSLNGLSDNYVLKAGDVLKVYGEREKVNKVVVSNYKVQKGDTLYSIARNNKMELKKLLEINNIKDASKYTLQIGANLKIESIKSEYADETIPDSSFQWPYRGIIVARYGVDTYKLANRGINILGNIGDKVSASDYGIIEYANDIRGFGKVVIIKHKNGFTTSYAHLSKIAVKLGDIVNKGDYIGDIGDTGLVDKSELYFKISYRGRALDPIKLLPKD